MALVILLHQLLQVQKEQSICDINHYSFLQH